MGEQDLVEFIEDRAAPPAAEPPAEPWSILIVDDDEEIHRATVFALRGVRLFGRPLQFHSALSAEQARRMLEPGRFACILLDVVMEEDDAGLRLVEHVREVLRDHAVRIVLRTGQPGYAPELEVIQKYDINDYRAKSELTSVRLTATLAAALRSYRQICDIERARAGLEALHLAVSGLIGADHPADLCAKALQHLAALLGAAHEGLVGASAGPGAPVVVLAAAGAMLRHRSRTLDALDDPALAEGLRQVFDKRQSSFADDHVGLHLETARGARIGVWLPLEHPLSDLQRRLVELFGFSVAAGFEHACLFESLEDLAFRDPLTGLPNRAAFERTIQVRGAAGARFDLVLADLDNFQAVNDGLGHDVGDRTLKATAALLQQVLGEDAVVARISADSFALLHAGPRDELEAALRRLTASLDRGLAVDGHEVPLSMSFGIAAFPDHGSPPATAFRNAGIALKQAKRIRRSSWQYFDPGLEQALQRRLQTVAELRHAVEQGQLVLHYQPQVDLADRRLCGMEALLRWQRGAQVLCMPSDFIPAAEDSGRIVAIGQWVLREACRQQQRWQQRFGRAVRMAVNVSIRQMRDPDFVAMLREVLAQTSIEPRLLELEVTESLMIEDTAALAPVLQQVRQLGVGMAIDDFGVGYSSLSRLRHLPIDRLKIDRTFVSGLGGPAEDEVIAELVINMGHLLHLKVVAEGVETEAQWRRLRELGCDEGQGYLFGRPAPAEVLEQWLH